MLGDGDGTREADRLAPVEVVGLTGAVEIAAGQAHSCALRAAGSVVCWGNNEHGQIGDGTRSLDHIMPTEVVGLTDAVEITAGGPHSCARRASGGVVCWGANEIGEIGDVTFPAK